MALTTEQKLERQKQAQKRYYEKNKNKIIERNDKNYKHLVVKVDVYNKLKKLSAAVGVGVGKFIENLINK